MDVSQVKVPREQRKHKQRNTAVAGSYIELVVSASKSLVQKSREEILELATRELAEFFPSVREAKVVKAAVIKEIYATYAILPGLDQHRPGGEDAVAEYFSGRRLDRDRLAGHHGRRGAQRIPGGRSVNRTAGPAAEICCGGLAGHRVDEAILAVAIDTSTSRIKKINSPLISRPVCRGHS